MAENLTIRIREEHKSALTALAEENWRDDAQQASFMIEQALVSYRARSDPNAAPRRTRGRSRNGLTHQVAAGIS